MLGPPALATTRLHWLFTMPPAGSKTSSELRFNGNEIDMSGNPEDKIGEDPITGLHKELFGADPPKHGTAYERLAALIVQELNQHEDITHDVKLVGDGKKTEHQIDVSVRGKDSQLHLIVECRHLVGDEGKKKLGLGAVRDFASVQRQLKADEAWMLTTVGYTGPAQSFAEEEGIRLGVLTATARPPVERIDFHARVGAPSCQRRSKSGPLAPVEN